MRASGLGVKMIFAVFEFNDLAIFGNLEALGERLDGFSLLTHKNAIIDK